jgi:hypothetical protein
MEIVHSIPAEQLIEQVREVTMLSDKAAYPYKDADIRIEEMSLDSFRPTQLYILRNHLELQSNLRQELNHCGIDTLRMIGGVVMRSANVVIGMLPPIVEDDVEYGPCLLDGTHRAYLARQLGLRSLNVFHITGINETMPMIAKPNEWNEMVEYDEIPVDKSLKKRYRDLPREKYNYYRDFSAITGIGKDPRSKMTPLEAKKHV